MQCAQRASGAGGNDWVLDIDIKAFFDSIDHALLLRARFGDIPAVRGCCSMWSVWLKAPMQREDGVIESLAMQGRRRAA